MLSTPKHGWVDVSVNVKDGDSEKLWVGRASYLTKPHFDLLDAFIDILSSKLSSSVFLEPEGWSINIVFNDLSVYIIEDKDELKVYEYTGVVEDLIRECCDDIKRDIKEWSEWGYFDYYPDEVEDFKKQIVEKLERVYYYLNK